MPGAVVNRGVMIREAGHRTRVSAKRHFAGRPLRDSSRSDGSPERNHAYGVHVAGGRTARRRLDFGPASG